MQRSRIRVLPRRLLFELRHPSIEQLPAFIALNCCQLAERFFICWIAICNVRAAQERTELLRLEWGNLRITPFTFARSERHQPIQSFTDTAPVTSLVIPQIDVQCLGDGSRVKQRLEIENRIIPSTGTRELSRLAAIRLNLRGDALISELG